MTVEDLASALLEECLADGSSAFVSQILDDARAALTSGKGVVSALTNSSANGKSFQRTVSLNPAEVMRACRIALNRFAGDGDDENEVASTVADFRQLSR